MQLLINAIELLFDIKDKFHFEIIGKMQNEEIKVQLYELFQKGYDIDILGEIDSHEITSHYLENDYFVFPSMGEMLPLVVQESLQNNLPVISSDIPACRSIIRDNINGFLFKANDVNDLARILRSVIEKPDLLAFIFNSEIDIHGSKMNYYEELYTNLVQQK